MYFYLIYFSYQGFVTHSTEGNTEFLIHVLTNARRPFLPSKKYRKCTSEQQ